MTRPSDRTIRELVNDLYHRLDIGSRPRSAEARLLEQITLAADALEARGNDLAQAVWDISDEAFLCGVSGDTSDRIREIEQRVRHLTGDRPSDDPP